MKTSLKQQVVDDFKAAFGCKPTVLAYAPGRVEVIGNHTDYNEGFVLSAAINFGTYFAIAPSKDKKCRLIAGDIKREVSFNVDSPRPTKKDSWSNYCKGVLAGLLPLGEFKTGFNAYLMGNVPQGAGLSSSAALETATGLAIAKLYGIKVDKLTLAKIGQKAEHEFAGCNCGLLDQISSIFGKKGCLVKTDFRSLEVKTVPMGSDVVLLVCDSKAKHALVDGAYNQRREDCEAAAAFFAKKLKHPVSALRDVSFAEWKRLRDGMPKRVANRAAHPIGEDERVIKGSALLDKGDLKGFGKLMFDSHASSAQFFENSCPELDFIVGAAKHIPGILGARLSGGGFGGSVVALTTRKDAKKSAAALAEAFQKKYGVGTTVREITPCAGARIVRV